MLHGEFRHDHVLRGAGHQAEQPVPGADPCRAGVGGTNGREHDRQVGPEGGRVTRVLDDDDDLKSARSPPRPRRSPQAGSGGSSSPRAASSWSSSALARAGFVDTFATGFGVVVEVVDGRLTARVAPCERSFAVWSAVVVTSWPSSWSSRSSSSGSPVMSRGGGSRVTATMESTGANARFAAERRSFAQARAAAAGPHAGRRDPDRRRQGARARVACRARRRARDIPRPRRRSTTRPSPGAYPPAAAAIALPDARCRELDAAGEISAPSRRSLSTPAMSAPAAGDGAARPSYW